MSARPRLVRSIPFWILLVGSIASIAAGAWLVLDKLATMNAAIVSGAATAAFDVYGGQALITVGGALIAAGIVGLVAVLFLGVLKSFVPAAAVEVVEPIDWAAESVEADEPVVESESVPTEPVAAEDEVVASAR